MMILHRKISCTVLLVISVQLLLPDSGPLFSYAQNQESLTAQFCPHKKLDSAFEIQVDLKRRNGEPMDFHCSTKERTFVGDLIQQGIQKTSKQLVDNGFFSNKESSFGSSVCKRSEKVSSSSGRRELEQTRNLRSVVQFFRYYGTMRCRLCDIDNYDSIGRDLGLCSDPVSADQVRYANKAHQVRIATPNNTAPFIRSVKMEFDHLLEKQNVHVNLNYQFKLDFDGPSFANAPTNGIRYFQWPEERKLRWEIAKRESSSSSAYTLSLQFDGPFLASTTTNDLVEIKTTYSGESAATDVPKLENVTVVYKLPDKSCPSPFLDIKYGGRLLTASNSAPVESPISTPASSPVSAPVSRPKPKQIAKTRKTIKKKKKVTVPASASLPMQDAKINKKKDLSALGASSPSQVATITKKKREQKKEYVSDSVSGSSSEQVDKKIKTMKGRKRRKKRRGNKDNSNNSNDNTDSTENNDVQEIVDENDSTTENDSGPRQPSNLGTTSTPVVGPTVSISNDESFMLAVNHALTLMLNGDLKTLLPNDHCLNGKGIRSVVQLTPKPEWEQNLPTCTVTDSVMR